MMKIIIISKHYGKINRGVEAWVVEMSNRFITSGNQVLILDKLQLKKVIKYNPDIVLPTNGGIDNLLVRLWGVIFGWKTIITGHAGIGRDDKWNILIRPDCFVSPSKRGEKWAKSLPYAKGVKIVYIPHGVDLDRFNPNTKKVKLGLERPIFLCVASNDEYKRVELAKLAVGKLNKGSLLHIGGKFKVAPDKMPLYYASCDVFTLPSDSHEAFGIAYLEAMASGLPVVATNDSLREEIVGKAGILVDPTDTQKYSSALQKAAEKDWKDLPREQAEKFSWESVISQYEQIFKKLI